MMVPLQEVALVDCDRCLVMFLLHHLCIALFTVIDSRCLFVWFSTQTVRQHFLGVPFYIIICCNCLLAFFILCIHALFAHFFTYIHALLPSLPTSMPFLFCIHALLPSSPTSMPFVLCIHALRPSSPTSMPFLLCIHALFAPLFTCIHALLNLHVPSISPRTPTWQFLVIVTLLR